MIIPFSQPDLYTILVTNYSLATVVALSVIKIEIDSNLGISEFEPNKLN